MNAKDLGTGKEQSIKITAPTKLSKEEIDKFVKEAEKFAGEDEKRKEEVEVKNQADTLVYSTEKSLKEYGDKLGAEDKKKIEDSIAELKDAQKGADIEKIKAGIETLTKASHKLAEEIYKKAAAEQQAKAQSADGAGNEGAANEPKEEQPSGDGKKEDEIIDAEYTAEDEKKKGKK